MRVFIILLLSSSIFFSQQNLDSIVQAIKTLPDTSQILILTDYTWENRSKDPHSALKSGLLAVSITESINDKKLQAKALNLTGVVYRNLGQFDNARRNYFLALKFAEEIKDSLQIAFSYNNIGGIYRQEGNPVLALEYILKALRVFENLGDKNGMSFCTINIGIIYRRQQNFTKALEYLEYTIKLRDETNDKPGKALALNHIAEVYYEMGDINSALNYYLQVEKEYSEVGDKKGLAAVWGGIASVYFIKGNYSTALEFRKRALDLSYLIHFFEGQVTNHNNIGRIYAKLGNFKDAEYHLNKALEIASGLDEIYIKTECYKYLSEFYEIKKDYKKSLEYHKIFNALEDSLQSNKKIAMVAETEAAYKYGKTEKENALLIKDIEIAEKQRNYFIIITILIFIITLITYNRYNTKKEANKKLEELNAMKDAFFKIIAHDLRAPFNTILSYTELLNDKENEITEGERIQCLIDLEKTARQNFHLLENLLLWSRSQTGIIEFIPSELNFFEIVQENIFLIEPTAKKKNITLQNNVDKEVNIYADENMLNTILRNLLSNALKYTNINGTITIDTEEKEKEIWVIVTDNGIGIEPKILSKLFSVSSIQSKSGLNGEKGSGLGLIICKDFVERHGGRIWVESELGLGSKFFFTIPQKT